MGHGEYDGLDEFLDLFVTAANISVLLRRALVNLHCFDTGIELCRKFFEDEIGVLVGPHKIGGFELVDVDESGYGEEDGLACGGADYGGAGFAGCVDVGGASFFGVFFF